MDTPPIDALEGIEPPEPYTSPDRAVMAEIGDLTVAELLGTFEANEQSAARLLSDLASAPLPKDVRTAIFRAWRHNEHRMWIYRLIDAERQR